MARALAAADVFTAIADPTRRRVLDVLRDGERAAGDLLGEFEFTQPALSQHLRVLREAGLVEQRRDGRHRRYRLKAERLGVVRDWITHYDRFWDQKLQSLREYLDAHETFSVAPVTEAAPPPRLPRKAGHP